VSNAEDSDIGMYSMESDGHAEAGVRVAAADGEADECQPGQAVLFAALRTKPYTVVTYAIDRKMGALKRLSEGPLAGSLPYIHVDKTGRTSSARRTAATWSASTPSQGRQGGRALAGDPYRPQCTLHRHRQTNRYVYVPHLGTDQIFQFRFDAKPASWRRTPRRSSR